MKGILFCIGLALLLSGCAMTDTQQQAWSNFFREYNKNMAESTQRRINSQPVYNPMSGIEWQLQQQTEMMRQQQYREQIRQNQEYMDSLTH